MTRDPREIAQRISDLAREVGYRVDVEKEEKYLVNKDGTEIGPGAATELEVLLWRKALAAEMPRWVPDFRKYARHLKTCKKGRQMPGSILTWECTCGLEVILAALPSPPREEAK